MAQIIEGDRRRSGQTGKSLCQCQSPHDNDNVVMHDPECNAILELDSSESSEESSEEEIVKCSTEPEVVGPAMELERRCEEMRRRNEALLKRFKEVEEDRRRAERRGAALLPKSTKLVKTSYSAHTTDVSDQWESLTITVMNQDTRLVARRSNGGRRQPKSRRLEDRLEKRCGDEKNILEERQLIICTIDNGEDAGDYCTDHSGSTSDVERREYLRWKRRNRSLVELLDQHQDNLAVHLQSSREQMELLDQDDLAVHLQSSREQMELLDQDDLAVHLQSSREQRKKAC
ncbi:coiled-coil domain-containing protein 9 isoform X4 [Oncorhynchus mykiss]|uniref:coiled-coil domain-containing protein 9 isoform X4 n=1 Tax=Oncorhynchus mykiss TaxID=8022 RepID=UPI0018788B15|nr:coiled-coil domain-containing protein 9 isoform X4 [Oncorhynchus mykiss]